MAATQFERGDHHCAIFPGDDHGATQRNYNECKLHPGHEEFMTVDEFFKKPSSEIGLGVKERAVVRNRIDRTVRVVVNHTSVHRPSTFYNSEKPYPCIKQRGSSIWIRYGTGYLVEHYQSYYVKGQCCCLECRTSTSQTPNRKSYYFLIRTATHVIFDQSEAQNTRFEFFYDSEDRDQVKNVYGVAVLDPNLIRFPTDMCVVVCVTHDVSLAARLFRLSVPADGKNIKLPRGVLISHPHGVSKKISVGDCLQSIIFTAPRYFVQLRKGMKIRFPGCHDARSVVQEINRLLDKPVIGHTRLSKNYVLLRDLIARRDGGVVLEIDFDDYWKHVVSDTKNKVWCNVFTPGTRLEIDTSFDINFEKCYKFPCKDHDVTEIRMEVFGDVKDHFNYVRFFNNDPRLYAYSRHNMPSCPGSSGAHVKSYDDYKLSSRGGQVHFGGLKDCSTSSLNALKGNDHFLDTDRVVWKKPEYWMENNMIL